LRWKGRPRQLFGGTEVYDMRARQWVPELGVFLSIDEYRYHSPRTTLWGWPGQNPLRYRDPSRRDGTEDLIEFERLGGLDYLAGFGAGLLDHVPLYSFAPTGPTLGDIADLLGASGHHRCPSANGDDPADKGRRDGVLAGGIVTVGFSLAEAVGAAASKGPLLLFHGTDVASAEAIAQAGLDPEAAAALGGGDVFWATAERSAADVFAATNPAGGAPAVISVTVPDAVLSSLQRTGDVVVNGSVYEFSRGAWDVLNEYATFARVH
jgi:hypothetical protein